MGFRVILGRRWLLNLFIIGSASLGLIIYLNLENSENVTARSKLNSPIKREIGTDNRKNGPKKWLIHPNSSSLYFSFNGQQDGIKNNCNLQKLSNLSNETKKHLFKSIIVVEKYKLLYCNAPKVGCSNWKRVIRTMMDSNTNLTDRELPMEEVHNRSNFAYLSDFSNDEIDIKLKSYFKFMFVRHPMARIYSAYNSKFVTKNDYFRSRFGKKILKTYRKNPPKNLQSPSDIQVTFEEFSRYLADTPVEEMEYHWRPLYGICHPCFVHYNYIGYLERIKEDSEQLLELINAPPGIHYPVKQSGYHTATVSDRELAFSKISQATLKDIISKYSYDFKLFGYSFPIINSKGTYKE